MAATSPLEIPASSTLSSFDLFSIGDALPSLVEDAHPAIPPDALRRGHALSVAPMLDVTNAHFIAFLRLLTRRTVLYTEMIHCNAILRSPFRDDLLRFDPAHHPVVLQLGGSDPALLAEAAVFAVEQHGYDEINLNCGCPSPRVVHNSFGACLMKDPHHVAACMAAISKATEPLGCARPTVKCRLGVDAFDSYAFLSDFVRTVHEEAGVEHFIIHARKALLKGLNPKENRTIPPLKYGAVFRLVEDFPRLRFSVNGGIKLLDTVERFFALQRPGPAALYGCMIGRAAMDNVWIFADADRRIFGAENPGLSRREVLQRYAAHCDGVVARCKDAAQRPFILLIKPALSLLAHEAGSKEFRMLCSSKPLYLQSGSFQKFFENVIEQVSLINPDIFNVKM